MRIGRTRPTWAPCALLVMLACAGPALPSCAVGPCHGVGVEADGTLVNYNCAANWSSASSSSASSGGWNHGHCGVDCAGLPTAPCTMAVCNTGQVVGPLNSCVVVPTPTCDDGGAGGAPADAGSDGDAATD
jgi:hypothetical protein